MDNNKLSPNSRIVDEATKAAYVIVSGLVIILLALIPLAMIAGVAKFIVWCIAG